MNGRAPADSDLVEAARGGDGDSFASVYDRYRDPIHDFCYSVLRDPHESADALHETFLQAWTKLDQLRDPSRLRPWLYAIARHECYRRCRDRARTHPSDEVPEMIERSESVDQVADHIHDAVLRETVWAAAASLSASDRALLDLQLRQGLEGNELAAAVGVSIGHLHVLTSRLRSKLESALGSLMVARLGREDCAELAELLDGWDGRYSSVIRKRVARHVDGCEECAERRSRLRPAALYAAVPVVAAPFGSRDRLLSAMGSAGAPPATVDRWRPRSDGFPPRPTPAWRQTPVLLATGAVVIIALVVAIWLIARAGDATDVSVSAGAAAEAAADEATRQPPTTDSSAPTGVATTPAATSSPTELTTTPTPTPPSTGGRESAPPAVPSPETTPPPTPTATPGTPPPGPAATTTAAPTAVTVTPSPTSTPGPTPPPSPTSTPSPTPPPADTQSPALQTFSVSPSDIWEQWNDFPLCVANAKVLVVEAHITDDTGVTSAVVEWQVIGGNSPSGAVAMQRSGDDWTAQIGPFDENTVAGGPDTAYDMTVTVTAHDAAGNTVSDERDATLHDCAFG